jgi:hypothetical protein
VNQQASARRSLVYSPEPIYDRPNRQGHTNDIGHGETNRAQVQHHAVCCD